LKSKNISKIKSYQELGKKFLQEYWLITPGEVRTGYKDILQLTGDLTTQQWCSLKCQILNIQCMY